MSLRKPLPKHLRVQILARDEYRCRMCGRTRDEVPLQVDHIVAVAAGGTDELSNLATLCRDCNLGKSSYKFADYTGANVLPVDLPTYFTFAQGPKLGDYEQFHLICYYQEGTAPGGRKQAFRHEWRIPGTVWDTSSDADALTQRRRKEEEFVFLTAIREQLAAAGTRLVVTEEGLCLV